MPGQSGRTLIHRLFDEVVNHWDFTHLDEIFAPAFRPDPEGDGVMTGPPAARQFLEWFRGVFPDAHYTVDDVVDEDDKAVARLHATGSHRGEYLGRSPSGALVSWTEMIMIRTEAQQIAQWWLQADRLGILEQIDRMKGVATSPR